MGYFVFGVCFFTTFFVHIHKPFVQSIQNVDAEFVQYSLISIFFVHFGQKLNQGPKKMTENPHSSQ